MPLDAAFSTSLDQQLDHALQQWQERRDRTPHNAQIWVRLGMAQFQLGEITASIDSFNQAEALDPHLTPYLWQRGLSYYYAGQFANGAEQFATDLAVNGRDGEETLWQALCLAQLHGWQAVQSVMERPCRDPRAIICRIYQLFAGDCSLDTFLTAVPHLKRSEQFYAHLYAGLFWEAQKEAERSQAEINQAVAIVCPEDYMWHLARVHQHRRAEPGRTQTQTPNQTTS